MKTEKELNEAILKITSKIHNEYPELSKSLAAIGMIQTPVTLRSKIHKGNFGAALLLAIFQVIKADINPVELSVILAGCHDRSSRSDE